LFLALTVISVSGGEKGVVLSQPVILEGEENVEEATPSLQQHVVPHALQGQEVSFQAPTGKSMDSGYGSSDQRHVKQHGDRVVPHAVASTSYRERTEPQGIAITGEEDTPIHARLPLNRTGKKGSLLRRYLKIINRKLGLTQDQKRRIQQILRERKQKWKEINRKFTILKKKIGRVPPAKAFMGAKRFNTLEFELAVTARDAQLEYLKKEKRNRYIRWMAGTLRRIHHILTPQQRRELIRLTNPGIRGSKRRRGQVNR
jgi:hypothetical protein